MQGATFYVVALRLYLMKKALSLRAQEMTARLLASPLTRTKELLSVSGSSQSRPGTIATSDTLMVIRSSTTSFALLLSPWGASTNTVGVGPAVSFLAAIAE
jgi:hypothetical protein